MQDKIQEWEKVKNFLPSHTEDELFTEVAHTIVNLYQEYRNHHDIQDPSTFTCCELEDWVEIDFADGVLYEVENLLEEIYHES